VNGRLVPPANHPPGRLRVGTCSWSDKTMVEAWYPAGIKTPADRLRYYATRFDTVEVDSSYYGLPSERNAALWVDRTPPGFTFHVKAFAMMTRHEIRPNQLPPELRDRYPLELDRAGRVIHPPRELREAVFTAFSMALRPLRDAGKLGLILLQFPPYFVANDANRAYLRWAVAQVAPDPAAVEFRHASWLAPDEQSATLGLLTELGAAYVSVDEPRIDNNTVLPPLAAVTSRHGYVRFHGRNAATWRARVASAAERFRYLYADDELREWVEPIRAMQAEATQTFVLFNNCYRDYAPRNAQQMLGLLGGEETLGR
jgi:uncharacterized protein YecE (DUF72 family)